MRCNSRSSGYGQIVFALRLFDQLAGLAGVTLGIALLGAAGIEGVQVAIAPCFSSEARQREGTMPYGWSASSGGALSIASSSHPSSGSAASTARASSTSASGTITRTSPRPSTVTPSTGPDRGQPGAFDLLVK